jgi:hypothetical protein
MFKKLNFNLKQTPDFHKLKRSKTITSFGNLPTPVLTYYEIGDLDYLNSLLPEVWKAFSPDEVVLAEIVNINCDQLAPHIDHGVTTALNYYIESLDAVTSFYELKENNTGYIYPGRTTANIFDIDQVIKLDSFTAKNNETFLLDVSKIHSVENTRIGVRRFIQWQWKYLTFDDVYKLFE